MSKRWQKLRKSASQEGTSKNANNRTETHWKGKGKGIYPENVRRLQQCCSFPRIQSRDHQGLKCSSKHPTTEFVQIFSLFTQAKDDNSENSTYFSTDIPCLHGARSRHTHHRDTATYFRPVHCVLQLTGITCGKQRTSQHNVWLIVTLGLRVGAGVCKASATRNFW